MVARGRVHEELLTRELTGLYLPARVTHYAGLTDSIGQAHPIPPPPCSLSLSPRSPPPPPPSPLLSPAPLLVLAWVTCLRRAKAVGGTSMVAKVEGRGSGAGG
jgi:hypothetical protein